MAYGTKSPTTGSRAHFSLPSILAIAAAIVSFFVHAGWGITLAIIAAVLGVIGFLLALAPGVRGGVISVASMLLGVVGIIVAIVKIVVPG